MYISRAAVPGYYISVFENRKENGHFFGEFEEIEDTVYFTFRNEDDYKHFNGICKCSGVYYTVTGLKGMREDINEDYVHLLEA